MNRITIRRAMLPLLVGVTLLTFGVACGGGGAASKGPQTVELAMKDNVFEPKAITVSAGQSVTINLKNVGPANLHNFHVMGDGVEPKNAMTQPIEPNKTDQIVVKFPKKGTYKFQCDLHVPDMAGTITVN